MPAKTILIPVIEGAEELNIPAFSFLITHPDGKHILFDLGVRRDWENMAPAVVERIKKGGWGINIEKDVAEILDNSMQEVGVGSQQIDAIIWSHYHWDHQGNVSLFPGKTDLVVGPGFKENYTPGYPTNPKSPINESDYKGRHLREIDFKEEGKGVVIGKCDAVDFFGDGSFYLLDTPGHAIGHMAGLARITTSPDTFVFMGGDACHHPGEYRPTEYLPLPTHVKSLPDFGSGCPGAVLEKIHPRHSATEPFYEVADGFSHDTDEAKRTIRKVEGFDAADNILVVIAHDRTLIGNIDFFPKNCNKWHSQNQAEKTRWIFVNDFKKAIRRAL